MRAKDSDDFIREIASQMNLLLIILFWLGACWLGYVYVGYPVLLWLVGILRPFHPTMSQDYLPKVSVLLSARNEQKDIEWKIAETLAWDYPPEKLELLVASDASEDGTDQILRNVSDPRFQYLRLEQRRGKNEALNSLNELAAGELLFFTDANSHIESGCLRNIVDHFADPRVGCVTGSERTIQEGEGSVVGTGTRAFLGYESLINTLESRLGSVLTCDGSIFCIRRSLYSRLQPELANDFELPIRIGAEGRAILFEPLSVSFERATSAPQEEFRRKRRICGQGVLGYWRFRDDIRGLRVWQFFSRKLLRWLGLIPLTMILMASVWLVTAPIYAIAVALQLVFYSLALVGWWFSARRKQGSRLITFPFYFLMVNVAAFSGVVGSILGKRFSVWESPTQSRGTKVEPSPAAATLSQSTCIVEDRTQTKSADCSMEMHSGKYQP
jgi:cellulose synthase/poly-beta-1,6-N-acetylglucosamine synthase-like glycosyltransferase